MPVDPTDKTPLQIAKEAFDEWLRCLDEMLFDAELSFEEFTGHGMRRELKEAGEALARAEFAVKRVRAELQAELAREP
jgi:hypothetical protein